MKTLRLEFLFTALTLFFTANIRAGGVPPIYEAFPSGYTEGIYLHGSGTTTFWDSGINITDITVQSASAMSVAGLFQAAGAKGVHFPSSETLGSKYTDHLFVSNPTSNSVFISFLFKLNAAPSANRAFLNLHSASGSGGGSGGILLWVDSGGKLQASKGNVSGGVETVTNGAAPALVIGATNFVVASYTFNTNSATDDVVDVWVNPSASSFGAAAPPAFTFEIGNGKTDIAQLKGIQILSGAVTSTAMNADLTALRCATNWAGVTPGISASPTNVTTATGGTATFNVAAGGTSLAYQWQLSTDNGATWTNVLAGLGGNAASYTTPALAAGDSGGQYRCLITNTEAAATSGSFTATTSFAISAAATVTVAGCSSAVISNNPVNQSVCAGSAAVFNVVASGALPAYQWQLSTDNGVTWSNLSGATSAAFFTNATSAANSNQFRCLASVVCDGSSATSAPALLLVNPLPAGGGIASAVICSNTGALLTLTNATDSPQWQVSSNNVNFSNIADATNSTYTTPALAQKTFYRAVSVNASSCAATSSVAVVALNAVSATNFSFNVPSGHAAALPISAVLARAGALQGAVSFAGVSSTTSPDGLPISTDATNIYLPATTAPQTFGCTVVDVCGDAAGATVTLHIVNTDYPGAHFNSFTSGATNSASLLFYGDPNASYHVQRTTNFTDWTVFGPVAANGFGEVGFTDTNAPAAQAFYRLQK